MRTKILDELTVLYGAAEAQALLTRVLHMLDGYRRDIARVATNAALSERDALLITYGDQVRAPDAPPLRTLADFLETHVRDSLSGVHILPFYPYSSDDGFSVIDYFAVDPALGSWDDVARLGQHFDLMFDAVVNHISAQSDWFQRFLQNDSIYRDYFISVAASPDLSQVVRPRALPLLTAVETSAGTRNVWTTFSADQIDLNFQNPNVLLAILDVLLFYVAHGARFIRLDAIAYLWKEIGTNCIHLPQTHAIIRLMRAALDEAAPYVQLITETNVPHRDNISYFGNGENEAQLVYNFALPPLTLHALQTGNAAKLARWADALTLPSERTTFFNFLASHDGIGLNPARGILSDAEIDALVARTRAHGGLVSFKHNADGTQSPYEMNINYFDALSNPRGDEPLQVQIDRFMCAQAIMLALVGMPGIYFHSLFGSRGDRAGADSSGIARRINRQKLTRAELERELAEPQSLRAQVFARYQTLLRARRAHPAFHPHGQQRVRSADARVLLLERTTRDEQQVVLCAHNVSNAVVSLNIEARAHGRLRHLLDERELTAHDGALALELQPYEVFWAEWREV